MSLALRRSAIIMNSSYPPSPPFPSPPLPSPPLPSPPLPSPPLPSQIDTVRRQSSAVSLVGSVCLGQSSVMEWQTVMMELMSICVVRRGGGEKEMTLRIKVKERLHHLVLSSPLPPPGTAPSPIHCRDGQFPCHDGLQCVDASFLCDGTPHCHDESDQDPQWCGESCDSHVTSIHGDVVSHVIVMR